MRGEYIRRADAMEKITSSETQKALRAMTGEEAYVTKETNLEVMGFYGYCSRGKQKGGD